CRAPPKSPSPARRANLPRHTASAPNSTVIFFWRRTFWRADFMAQPGERKLFFVSLLTVGWHNRRVIGAFLNALGILFGALLGLAGRGELSARTQNQIKSAPGGLTAFCGLQLVWQNVGGGFIT